MKRLMHINYQPINKENLAMSTEQHKAIVRRFFKAFESGNQNALKEVLAPDLVVHHPGSPEPLNLQTIGGFSVVFSEQQ
jgi:hypothetical protein